MEPARAPARGELLRRLSALNAVLERSGADPFITAAEAEAAALPDDNLAGMVAATADRVTTVAKALGGIP